MKKDYSKNNIFNLFGLNLPMFISEFISILISIIICLIFKNMSLFIILNGLIMAFLGLNISGYLFNKYCINKDFNKCKNCKCWNCNRKG